MNIRTDQPLDDQPPTTNRQEEDWAEQPTEELDAKFLELRLEKERMVERIRSALRRHRDRSQPRRTAFASFDLKAGS